MAVTMQASIKVGTVEVRHALKSVYAHHNKTKTDDGIALHRIRLTLGKGYLFVAATNGTSTGLAKIRTVEDSRGDDAAMWDPDDGPIIVDLQPRHVPILLQQYKAKAAASDVDQLISITADCASGEVAFEDIGGLWSSGERTTFQFDDPHAGMPDVIAMSGTALAAVAGQAERGKPLVQDGKILSLFKDAAVQYQAPLQIRSTGSVESRGFVVQCGPNFIGCVSSQHDDGDGMKKRDQWSMEWLRILDPRKLAVV